MDGRCAECAGPTASHFVRSLATAARDALVLCARCFCAAIDVLLDGSAVFLYIREPSALDNIELTVNPAPGAAQQYPTWQHPIHVHAWNTARFVCNGCDSLIHADAPRFRCADCRDFDLCLGCMALDDHAEGHAFYVLRGGHRMAGRALLDRHAAMELAPLHQAEWALPALVALDRASFGAMAWGPATLRRAHQPHKHAFLHVLLATDRLPLRPPTTAVAGYVCFEFDDDELSIDSIAVAEPWQGRGLGKLLLRHALAHAHTRPHCRHAALHVAVTNAAAFNLYRQHDFAIVGEDRDYYGAGQHAFYMRRTVP